MACCFIASLMPRARVSSAPRKMKGKPRTLFHLIWEVASARRHQQIGPRGHCFGVINFRVGVGHGKDDWILAIFFSISGFTAPLTLRPRKQVRAFHHVREVLALDVTYKRRICSSEVRRRAACSARPWSHT